MNRNYEGMRWFKCDLHMHTPVDQSNWCDDPFKAGQESEKAKEFAKACMDAGLDVVGITDHNFLSKDFIPYLEQAFCDIERESGHKITLFPGFEFEADVGRGMHVLCLFEPGTNVNDIDHILTECGVTRPRVNCGRFAKSTIRLPEILNIVQKSNADGFCRGVVILPHIFEDSLFDNDRISEWLQQEEYSNPDLFAVEVPKPISRMSRAFQILFRSGENCSQDWKRIRPIATIMSSDNKKLNAKDENGKPKSNSIGFRYSWIKMSKPSIESLRQAFLDHDSRIALPDDVTIDVCPSERVRSAKIQSISIKDVAFLANQIIHFSPNMNCVIGSRGSGKSTLLEYLRIAMGNDQITNLDRDTVDRITRIRETLFTDKSELIVHWINEAGVEDFIIWKNGNRLVQERDLVDPETFFKSLDICFFSQQQLNRLTETKRSERAGYQVQRLVDLIDGFKKSELSELANQERRLKIKVQEAFSNSCKIHALEKDYKQLQQEYMELDRQCKARSEIQEDSRRNQLLKYEARYLEELFGTPGKKFSDVSSLVDQVVVSHEQFKVADSPHADWFKQFDERVKELKVLLAISIQEAINQFYISVDQLKTSHPDWPVIMNEIEEADSLFNKACAEKGLTTDDVGHLQEISQTRDKKRHDMDKLDSEIKSLIEMSENPESILAELHHIWFEQYSKRLEAAGRANGLALLNERQGRFIEVCTKFQQDKLSFSEIWQTFAPTDGRTRLGRNWESCGSNIYDLFTQQDEIKSPWKVLINYVSEEVHATSTALVDYAHDLRQHILDNPDRWEKLLCSRVQDAVDLILYRSDGSRAGSIAEGSLSDGQRNTAALALLLAQSGGPIVIDQPEDELDSNFVFNELIPMLRKVKTNRQIIMSTHNANLPVNGDAELIYAFDSLAGKGVSIAQGGLDQKTVTKAVLNIMEGTEEAFRKRREKYHF